MKVDVRIYRRFDMDLVALQDAGYPLSAMIKEAVCGYANNTPVHYYIDEYHDFNICDKKGFHLKFSIPDTDTRTCYLLKHIKYGYRTTFCKMVFRNALVQQNLTGFFSDDSLLYLQNINLGTRNIHLFQNVIPCSALPKKSQSVTFLGRTVKNKVEKKNLDTIQNPFVNTFPTNFASNPSIPANPFAGGYKGTGMNDVPKVNDANLHPLPETLVSVKTENVPPHRDANFTYEKPSVSKTVSKIPSSAVSGATSAAADNDDELMSLFDNL